MHKRLEFAGIKTHVAHTGTGAINKIEEQPPDLILLEITLSDIDALEVVRLFEMIPRTVLSLSLR